MTAAPGTTPAADPVAVRWRGLVKQYGQVTAVAGVDLDVYRGRFLGLVGPNGAGKTTALAMSTGLLRPDGGAAIVDGVDVWRDPQQAKRRMGVLPEGLRLFDRLSGRELLEFSGRLRGIPEDEIARRSAGLLGLLGLADAGQQLVVDYSTGMRKKIALANALLHNPSVLFLDEPFEAVDPVSARTIREVLRGYTGRGGTVVLSSHVMDLVERLCHDVAIMAGGRILLAGPVEAVRGGRSLEEIFVELVGSSTPVEDQDLGWLGTG